jgi:RNA polymerase sigma-70 factor (ECF subfamily)
MAEIDDARLLQHCLAGSQDAWEAFVDRFAAPVAEVCRRTLRRAGRPHGPQEAQDMLQEVFLHLLKDDFRVLRDYQGRAPVASYLAAVAVYKVLGDRSLRRVPQGGRPDPASPAAGPHELLERQEALELLRREVEQLPLKARLALTLQAKGASLREIQNALGISEDAAAQLLSRARALLKERFR